MAVVGPESRKPSVGYTWRSKCRKEERKNSGGGVMQATILIGHGSLRSESGAAMIRIAARLRASGVSPLAEACFLNFSRPTLDDMVAKCLRKGARRIVIQPYFLVAGKYVCQDLPELVIAVARRHPDVPFELAEPFSDHPNMIELVLKRVSEVKSAAGGAAARWGLLLMAHGSPLKETAVPLYAVMQGARQTLGYECGEVGFLECQQPDIMTAVDRLAGQRVDRLIALPYFLHRGRHVHNDLPRLLHQAQRRHPNLAILLAPYLGYDLLLAQVVAARNGSDEQPIMCG